MGPRTVFKTLIAIDWGLRESVFYFKLIEKKINESQVIEKDFRSLIVYDCVNILNSNLYY